MAIGRAPILRGFGHAGGATRLPQIESLTGRSLDVAGKKREKSLSQTDKKTPAKPKRPKKTSRGK
jgi:hypothetical protein